ncbi:MAG: hypothetical protein ACRDH5_13655 [bacterium]
MDVLTPVVTGALLALFTGIQYWINKGRFDSLEERFDRRFEQLSAEIAQIRADLLQVALAVGSRPQTG